MRFGILIAMLFPALLRGQLTYVNQGVWLQWDNVKVALAPDSSGTTIWVQSRADRSKNFGTFGSTLVPEDAAAWVEAVRSFMRSPQTDGDTSAVRTSLRIRTAAGDGMYVARRQREGRWTEERFLILESAFAREPLIVNGDDKSIGEILDSLESVVRRTPIVAARPKEAVDPTAYTEATVEKPASGYPDNRPPLYPPAERKVNRRAR
jgi:hypothetical protein